MASEYIVQPGDTLSAIAGRLLGSPSKWRVLADLNGLHNPNLIRPGQKLRLPPEQEEAAPVNPVSNPGATGVSEQVRMLSDGTNVHALLASTGEKVWVGRLFRAGLFRAGLQEPEAFLQGSAGLLRELDLSPSEINVILATSENEGNLDAVNTWDSQFLSFGFFQWTAGGAGSAGELPALLQIVKDSYPEEFHRYWGQFGLDVVDTGSVTGWLSLHGRKLVSAAEKTLLREHIWAYRFARAGASDRVKAAQMLHAINRVDRFYAARPRTLGGHSLAELITSELGVALLLDNHVNRPGYVFGCVAEAIARCGLTPEALAASGDADEQRLIDAYIDVRAGYGATPMTNAHQRAEVTRDYLARGVISNRRGSFVSNGARRAGG